MKIAVDAAVLELPLTGIGKTTLRLYEQCLQLRPDLEVVFLHRKPLQCALPLQARSLQRARWLPSKIWRAALLPGLLKKLRPDWAHFPWNGHVVTVPGVKTVTTLHDILPLAIPGYFASDGDKAAYHARAQGDISRSDLLATVSQYSADEIMKAFQVRAAPLILRHGPTLTPAPSGSPKVNDFFLYAGGYDPRKGLPELLRVFTRLRQSGRLKSRLVLTGSQNYFSPEFKRLVGDAVGAGLVVERGYVPDADLSRLLDAATALVYPSLYEGFGLPPLEAMAAGCPVLATHGTSIPEICGDAACLADPGNEREFGDALVRLEQDAGWREELRQAGLKRAGMFSWRTTAEKFLSALEIPA
jgi:alpha-1,3-rhamnosyl/mannosyltransferase